MLGKLGEENCGSALLFSLFNFTLKSFASCFGSRRFFDCGGDALHVDEVVPDLQGPHACIVGYPLPIRANRIRRRLRRITVSQPEMARRNDHTCGQSFDIPFPGSRKGLIEVIDVENYISLRCGKASEIIKWASPQACTPRPDRG